MAEADCTQKRRGSKWGARVEKPCGWCSAVMVLKPALARKRECCSASCASKLKAKRRGQRISPDSFVCGWCHCETTRRVRGAKDDGRYCSIECYNAKKSAVSSERLALRRIGDNWRLAWAYSPAVQAEIDALRRIASYPYKQRLTIRQCSGGCGAVHYGYMEYGRTCPSCKAEIKRRAKRAAKKSERGRASKREYRARRRALERGAMADRIDPIVVFERDKWRCHLCGCATPRKLRGTYEPNAPELDHVVPLAAGGGHTWGNVKCACRRCNGLKSDKPMGQLGLEIAA